VNMERDVPCTTRDGVTLFADIYRPADDGSYPVLLMRTPYDKTLAQSDIGYAHPSWYARHGYVVVIQDCRGRGQSEGEFYFDRNEAEDGFETVEWAAKLPSANGRVGMYGASYVGRTQLMAATLRPPNLRTIIPAFTYGSMYDVIYRAGAFQIGLTLQAAIFHAHLIAARSRAEDPAAYEALVRAMHDVHRHYWNLPLRSQPFFQDDHAPWWRDWIDHPCYDDYWRANGVSDDFSRITVPALHITGSYDICLSMTVETFRGLQLHAGEAEARSRQKLLIGPWQHMPWLAVTGASPEIANWRVVDDWQVLWFDQLLKDHPSHVLDSPVTAYVQGDGWRDLPAWPPDETNRKQLFFHSGGRANTREGDGTLSEENPGREPPDVYAYDPAFPTMAEGGHSCCWPGSPMGPEDQTAAQGSKAVLTFTSAPLHGDVDVVGDLTVRLYAASTARDTDFVARVCVVDTCGCARNLQEGIVRARFRESLEKPELIEPGTVYQYEIALGPVAVRFTRGQRVRVAIASADFPQWDRNLNTGGVFGTETLSDAVIATQFVFHDAEHPSSLSLPWAPIQD
jgi:uncharacterized protein